MNRIVAGEVANAVGSGGGRPVRLQGNLEIPAPTDDLRPLALPLRCQFLPREAPDAGTLFGGLAPGMVGIYQVSLRVPQNAPARPSGMQCAFGSGGIFTF